MQERVRKVHRILDVQRDLHRLEEHRLLELQRRLAELETAQSDLLQALNDDAALQGLFIDTMARRLRKLVEEAQRVTSERDLQAVRLSEHAARVAGAERLCRRLDAAAAREEEGARLLDAIERYVGHASLRQDC